MPLISTLLDTDHELSFGIGGNHGRIGNADFIMYDNQRRIGGRLVRPSVKAPCRVSLVTSNGVILARLSERTVEDQALTVCMLQPPAYHTDVTLALRTCSTSMHI